VGKRVRGEGRVVILSEGIYRVVRATSLALGTTPGEVVTAGCRVFCTYVLREMGSGRLAGREGKEFGSKWQVKEIVRVLALRFGSRGRK
jgi:hypothetical protein